MGTREGTLLDGSGRSWTRCGRYWTVLDGIGRNTGHSITHFSWYRWGLGMRDGFRRTRIPRRTEEGERGMGTHGTGRDLVDLRLARFRGSVKWRCEFMVVNPWLMGGVVLCPPLICTKRCVYGGVWGEGNAVSRWETTGEVFFRGVRRRVPSRTVRILGERGARVQGPGSRVLGPGSEERGSWLHRTQRSRKEPAKRVKACGPG
jgi:hypothetical protein